MILPFVIRDKLHQHILTFLKILLDLLARFLKVEFGNAQLMIFRRLMKTNLYTPVKKNNNVIRLLKYNGFLCGYIFRF